MLAPRVETQLCDELNTVCRFCSVFRILALKFTDNMDDLVMSKLLMQGIAAMDDHKNAEKK